MAEDNEKMQKVFTITDKVAKAEEPVGFEEALEETGLLLPILLLRPERQRVLCLLVVLLMISEINSSIRDQDYTHSTQIK